MIKLLNDQQLAKQEIDLTLRIIKDDFIQVKKTRILKFFRDGVDESILNTLINPWLALNGCQESLKLDMKLETSENIIAALTSSLETWIYNRFRKATNECLKYACIHLAEEEQFEETVTMMRTELEMEVFHQNIDHVLEIIERNFILMQRTWVCNQFYEATCNESKRRALTHLWNELMNDSQDLPECKMDPDLRVTKDNFYLVKKTWIRDQFYGTTSETEKRALAYLAEKEQLDELRMPFYDALNPGKRSEHDIEMLNYY